MPPFAAVYAPTAARAASLVSEPNVDDLSASATGDHALRHLLADNESAREICVDHALPVIECQFHQWLAKLDSRVVDQDVDVHVLAVPLGEGLGNGSFIRDIECAPFHPQLLRLERGDRLGDCIRAGTIENHLGTRGRQPSASAKPMPRADPVIRAVRPFRSKDQIMISCCSPSGSMVKSGVSSGVTTL
jgi:hypothetical protein